MTRLNKKNLIATLAYADVFDYPLTKGEVSLWAVGAVGIVRASRGIEDDGTYLTLTGRKRIVALRKKRARFAAAKWQRIMHVSTIFRLVPTVILVGVTGGLAMDNADEHDDIDLFFIVASGTLWISRLMVTLLAEVTHMRRRPGQRRVTDKVCLNMFMTEDALTLPVGERDLFSAHEVLQMVPLWDRDQAYRKMLFRNEWVAEFLPAAWKAKTKIMVRPDFGRHDSPIKWFLSWLEPIVARLQLRYMESRRTNEVILTGMLRFHPQDARHWVKKKFAIRLKRYDIPLDKFFYHR